MFSYRIKMGNNLYRVIFVTKGIGDKYIVAYKKDTGSLARYKGKGLDPQPTALEMQRALDKYAVDNGLAFD